MSKAPKAFAKSADKFKKDKSGKPNSSKAKPNRTPHFYGIHAVTALLKHRPQDALALFVQLREDGATSQTHDDIMRLAKDVGVSVQMTHKDKLAELCDSHQHQGGCVIFGVGSDHRCA